VEEKREHIKEKLKNNPHLHYHHLWEDVEEKEHIKEKTENKYNKYNLK